MAVAFISLCLLGIRTHAATFRYANSNNRIYVENGGVATLTDIKAVLPHAPLELVEAANKVWLLRANLIIADGCTLLLHGAAAGGDVNELRLLSNDSVSVTDGIVSVDADWGTLDLNATRVTSWNQAANGPDTEYQVYKRAFIRARSRVVNSVVQQSTLNVVNSDIGYLGFRDNEGYGLTWQVVGSADGVRVFGNVSGSRIYHCQLDVGTWAVDDVVWSGDEIAFSTLHGFDSSDPGHRAVVANGDVHDNDYRPVFRWASTSWRIYVTGQGAATLSDIVAAVPQAPLTLVDPVNKIWYVSANLFVEKGAKLNLYGPAIGGDVAELRLKSENTPEANAFVELRADWGWLDIRNTRITSWDSAVNGPDLETDTYRRAYVRARSTLDPDGVTAHESRMDVANSDIGYLGSHNTEAYGLVWKVVDTTAIYLPPGSPHTLFDVVNVYGDILNSRLHNNYFGMYSYGHDGGRWANNEVDNNIGYGFDPHDDSDHLVIENNNVHDNGWHGIIASKRCDHGIIRNNRSWNNGRDPLGRRGNGIMLHRSCNSWLVENNQSYGNADSGIAIFASSFNGVYDNVCLNNGNAGIRLSVGAANNVVDGNEIGFAGRNGLYLYQGNDPPEADDDDPLTAGRPRQNLFSNNIIHDYAAEAIKVDNGDANAFIANQFSGTNTTFRFAQARDNLFASNAIPAGARMNLAGATTNRATTLIEGQPQMRLQLDAYCTGQFEDTAGAIFDAGQGRLETIAGTGGSLALATMGKVGGTPTIVKRDFFVQPDTGTVLVRPGAWNLGNNLKLTWNAQASSSGVTIRYTIGGLTRGTTYTVVKGAVTGGGRGRKKGGTTLPVVGNYTADSRGNIAFSIQPGSTANLTYSIIGL